MPRSLKRPNTGQIVWYYSAAPPTALLPLAAMVIKSRTDINRTTFDLTVFAADGTVALVAAVPFYDGTRPTTGAWCTRVRVNEPAAGAWPSDK